MDPITQRPSTIPGTTSLASGPETSITAAAAQRISQTSSCFESLKNLLGRACVWFRTSRLVKCIVLIFSRVCCKTPHRQIVAPPNPFASPTPPPQKTLDGPTASPLSPGLTTSPPSSSLEPTETSGSVSSTPPPVSPTAPHALTKEFEDFKKHIEETYKRVSASAERFTKPTSQLPFSESSEVDQLCELLAEIDFAVAFSESGQWRFKELLAKDTSFNLEVNRKNLNQLKEQLKKATSEKVTKDRILSRLKSKLDSLEKELKEQKKTVKPSTTAKKETETKEKAEAEGKLAKEDKPHVNFIHIQYCHHLKYQFCLLRDHLQIDIKDPLMKLNKFQVEFGLVPHHADPMRLFGIGEALQRDQGGLFNITNSCYINSTIAYMRPVLMGLVTRVLTQQPGESEKKYHARLYLKWLITEILQLSMAPLTGDRTHDDKINKALLAALYDFRFRLFEAGLSADFRFDAREGYAKQQDGTELGNTLLEIFQWALKEVKTYYTKIELNEIEFGSTEELVRFISIDLPNGESADIQKLISAQFGRIKGTDDFRKVREYEYQSRFQGEAPPFLLMQIKRVILVTEKDLKELDAKKEEIRKKESDEIQRQLIMFNTPIENMHTAMELAVHSRACDALGIDERLEYRKISTPLVFPVGYVLDLSAAFGRPTRYRLVGAQKHHGETAVGGHLTAAAFDHDRAHLRYYDDNKVTIVPPEEQAKVLSSACNISLELMP